ncbi:DUF3224 domain-containing protein [Mucilaginibacter sp. OK098]|uniref:DUF3224 domain-containing protein n=1 Tax=Mucilaginibacter sp. OK098 TaxID=1855297 RepID=UPI0009237EE0|nr:DUF3224 domain-containing protein [Mucilaginibacter sp. OK098]SHM20303.1 Protein of unknown function [Mucilaginibacter sp. OK098]
MNVLLKLLVTGAVSTILMINGPIKTIKKEKHMQAKGTFEVKVNPAETTQIEKDAGIGRFTIDKKWSGDLAGTSKGSMLTSLVESTGTMAYVALEKVDGKLGGKSGSFYFTHNATMKKGDASSGIMKIVVVAGTGTGELTGISGELKIIIDAKGGHSYIFDYELP